MESLLGCRPAAYKLTHENTRSGVNDPQEHTHTHTHTHHVAVFPLHFHTVLEDGHRLEEKDVEALISQQKKNK